MIAFRVEIRCDGGLDGCRVVYARGFPYQDAGDAHDHSSSLEECALRDGWVRDGVAHFCPQCQIQRERGPIIDALALHIGAAT